MTSTQIHSSYKNILHLILNNKISEAYNELKRLSTELTNNRYLERIEQSQQSYRFMLQYFIKGVDDPKRNEIYDKIVAECLGLSAKIREELLAQLSNNYEFMQIMHNAFQPLLSIDSIKDGLNREEKIAQLREIGNDSRENVEKIEKEFENVVKYLFNYFWLTAEYNQNGMTDLCQYILSDQYDENIAKSIIVTAITFNSWRTFNENKIMMLIECCENSNIETAQRAIVGLCFVLGKFNRFIPHFPIIKSRLTILFDNIKLKENFESVINQIIETTETEEISRKLKEEIYPEIMKLRSLNNDDFSIEDIVNSDEWGEENPKWKEMIEKIGVSDKMEEFAEMQMNGADVYMSTFAQLKSFPFFNQISNWFLPFDKNHSEIRELFLDDKKSFISIFMNSPVMCNSDKYSFCLSIKNSPAMQQNMMNNAMTEVVEQLEDMKKEKNIYQKENSNLISKYYVQDLFRFFKLNQYRNDFSDMFSISLLMHKTSLFDILATDSNIKYKVADYYFSKKLYSQALEIYKELEKSMIDAHFYQKMGYAYQQTNQLFDAIKSYERADLISSEDFWTNRKIAMCYRLVGNFDKAISSYKQAKRLKKENVSVRMQLVNCYLEQKIIKKAVDELSEMNMDFQNNIKIERKLVEVSLLDCNISKADYYRTLLFENKSLMAVDFMLGGHIAWIMNRMSEAKAYYVNVIQKLNNDFDRFEQLLLDDMEILTINGVDKQDIYLMIDVLKESV